MPKTPWEEALALLRSSAGDGIRLSLHWPSCCTKRRRPNGIFVGLKLLTMPTCRELQSLLLGIAVEAVLAVEEERVAMRSGVLYFDGCPNHAPTVERVKQMAVDLGVSAKVEEIEVTSLDQAQQLRFLGSPTVRVNSVDIDPSARQQTNYGLSCRVYSGVSGVPPDDLIMAALPSPSTSA